MNTWHSFRKLFSRPYPPPESFIQDFRGVAIGGLIVTAILYGFRPFGLSFYQGSVIGIALLFGVVSCVAGIIYLVILRHLVQPMSYQAEYYFGKWVLEILGLMLFIAIGNWFVFIWMNQGGFTVSSFITSLLVTMLIGIIPTIIFGLQNQIKQEQLNTATAQSLAAQLTQKSEELLSPTNMILAIQAMENYINVFSLSGDVLNKEAIRRTLKSAQQEEMYQSLIKCHRSYLVNPAAIIKVQGNAQGLKLSLGHEDCPIIPVSRSYITKVRSLLS